MKTLLLFFFIGFHFIATSQEICSNGIDDDGDGLIDLNDVTNCNCPPTATTVSSLIPNSNFEQMSCCPSGFGQLSCATGWVQASPGTSDYWHACDFDGIFTIDPPELPAPFGGQGHAGFYSATSTAEYIGACLNSPMIAGTDYSLQMQLASSGATSLELTIYGTPNCSDIPFTGATCPMGQGSWVILTSVIATIDANGQWGLVTLNFNPSVNINAIVIGGPCNESTPGNFTNRYFYVDELTLNTTASFTSGNITEQGGWCTNDYKLIGEPSLGATYQWYNNGVALIGQTNATLELSNNGFPAGDYSLVTTSGSNCSINSTTVNPPLTVPVTINDPGLLSIISGSVFLTADQTGGIWSGTGIQNPTTGLFNTAVLSTGQYIVTYTTPGACGSSDSHTVFVDNCTVCNIDYIRQTFTDAGCEELDNCGNPCSMYFYNPLSLTGIEAQAFAQNYGANLVSVQSAFENECIEEGLEAYGFNDVVWIGFNDENSEGNFTWFDQSNVSYTNWASGEPNNSGGIENFVQIYSNGSWNDLTGDVGNSASVIEVNLCPQSYIDAITLCSSNDQTLTTSAILGSSPYQYTWTSQPAGLMSNSDIVQVTTSTTTTYSVAVIDRNGCATNSFTTLTANDPTLDLGPDRCFTSGIVLSTSFTYNSYEWSDGSTGSTLAVTTPGTYYCDVYSLGTNIIQNNDFEQGNNAFNSSYAYTMPENNNESEYTVSPSPNAWHSGFAACTDHTPSGSSMLLVNGSQTANTDVWCRSYTVSPNSEYSFSAWLTNLVAANPAALQFSINDLNLGTTFSAPNPTCTWTEFTTTWNSGANSTANICIVNQTTSPSGNDFAIDDIYFGTNCKQTDTIIVHANPTANAGADITICSGDVTTIGSTAITGTTYSWTPTLNLSLSTVSNPTASPTVSTEYTVTIVDSNGCSGSDMVMVNNYTPPTANAGTDVSMCSNGTIGIGSMPVTGMSYIWSPTTGLNSSTIANPVATGNSNTTYTVTVTETATGCSDDDAINVIIYAQPIISVNDVSVCIGSSVSLSASGAETYTWSPATGLSSTSGNPITANPTATTTYTSVGTDINGCVNSTNFIVTVNPLPSVSAGEDQALCEGETTTLNGTGNGTINWSDNIENNQSFEPNEGENTYNVTVTDANGCVNTDEVIVNVFPYPVASFQANPTQMTVTNPFTQINNQSINGSTYSWDFGDGFSSTQENPTHTYPANTGIYTISLIVTSEYGCVDTTSIDVLIQEDLIYYIPNTFTPDGNELNNTFQPVFTSGFDPFDFNLLIYNRWGETIFESKNVEIGWDGTYQGELANSGTYTWSIEFKVATSDERIIKSGHVNVLR